MDEVRRGVKWMRDAPRPEEPIMNKVRRGLIRWSKLRKARVGVVTLVAISLLAYGLFSAQAGSTPVVPGRGPVGPGPTGQNHTETLQGSVAENGNASQEVTFEATRLSTLNVTLSWSDEPVGFGLQNQPDSLGLEVRAPNGKNWSKAATTASPLTWSLDDPSVDYGAGAWTFTIIGGSMGDITRSGGLPGPCPRCSSDTMASYTLRVEGAW
jgi:hypothetical protein